MNWIDDALYKMSGDGWTGIVMQAPVGDCYHVMGIRSDPDLRETLPREVYVTASRHEALEAADATARLSHREWWQVESELPPRFRPVKWEVFYSGARWSMERASFTLPAGCSEADAIAFAEKRYASPFVTIHLDTLRRVIE